MAITNLEAARAYRQSREKKPSLSSSSTNNNLSMARKRRTENELKLDSLNNDLTSMNKTISGIYSGWQDSNTMASTKKQVEQMHGRLNSYKDYMSTYGSMTDSQAKELNDVIAYYDNALASWDNAAQVYGQYQNAKAYDKAVQTHEFDEKYSGQSYEQIQEALKSLEEGSDEHAYLSNYRNYSTLEDFDKALANYSEDEREANLLENLQSGFGFRDETYAEKLQKARDSFASRNDVSASYYALMQNEDFAEKSKYSEEATENGVVLNPFGDKATAERYYNHLGKGSGFLPELNETIKNMTDEEKAIGMYLYNTKGDKELLEYLEDMEYSVAKRTYDKNVSDMNAFSDSGVLPSFLNTAASLALRIGNLPGVAIETIGSKITGDSYNPYGGASGKYNAWGDVQQNISENIAEATEGFEIGGTNVPSFLYNTALSGVESKVGMSLGSIYTMLMGTGAYASTYKDGLERGLSEEDATSTALFAGAAETLFEYISFDKFKALKGKPASDWKQVIKNTVSQFGVEGSEEFFTDIANSVTDALVNGGDSVIAENIASYEAQGYSKEESWNMAKNDFVRQLTESFVGGGLIGGVSAGALSISQHSGLSKVGNRLEGKTSELADGVSGLNVESAESKKYIESLNRKYNNDLSKASKSELGYLYSLATNDYASQEMDAHTKDIADTLLSLEQFKGIENASDIANAVAKRAVGYKLSTEEKNLLKSASAKDMLNLISNGGVDIISSEESIGAAKQKESFESLINKNFSEVTDVKVEGNTVTLTTGNGEIKEAKKNLTANELEFIDYASTLPGEAKKAFLENNNGKVNADVYTEAFGLVYQYGRQDGANGVEDNAESVEKIIRYTGNILSAEQIRNIYSAGLKSASIEAKVTAESLASLREKWGGKIKGEKVDKSEIDESKLTGVQKSILNMLEGFASLGMRIKVINDASDTSANGTFDISQNAVTINLSARYGKLQTLFDSRYVVNTMAHEFTHWMEVNAPDVFRELKGTLINYYGEKWDGLVELQKKSYEKNHKDDKGYSPLSDQAAESEVVARACEDMLSDAKAMKAILEASNESFLQKFKQAVIDFFDSIIGFLEDFMKGFESQSTEAKLVRQNKEQFEKMREIFVKGITQGLENVQARDEKLAEENAKETDGVIQYSMKDSEGNTLSEDQVEFFKDSKVRDENGNLLVVYHGTRKADFNVFNRNFNFFTNSTKMADSYAPTGEKYKVYLNMRKPFIVDAHGERWSGIPIDEDLRKLLNQYGESTFKEKGKWRTSTADIVSLVEDINDEGEGDYDGVIIRNVEDTGGYGEGKLITADDYIVFNSNQIKNVDNTAPTDNPDIRFSDKVDSQGNELSEQQVDFFKDSKAVDNEGNLMVVYHGTVREFYTFDKSYANPEGNMGSGFYFTSDVEDVERNYANVDGADLTNKIEREADILEGETDYEDMSHEEIVEMLRKKYITAEEPITMETYLKIKNPCYVGKNETYLMSDISDEYNIDDFEDEEEYYAEVDQMAENYIEDIMARIDAEGFYNTDDIPSILFEAYSEGGITLEDLKSRLNNLYIENENGELVSNEVARIIVEQLGYDGIIDSTVSSKFKNMGMNPGTIHYIVFNSNQIKLTSNKKPTSNSDIRFSDKTYVGLEENNQAFFYQSNLFDGKRGAIRERELIRIRDNKPLVKGRYERIRRGLAVYDCNDALILTNEAISPVIKRAYVIDVEVLDSDTTEHMQTDWYEYAKELIIEYEKDGEGTYEERKQISEIFVQALQNKFKRKVAITIYDKPHHGFNVQSYQTTGFGSGRINSTGVGFNSYGDRVDGSGPQIAQLDSFFSDKVDNDVYKLLGENKRLEKENKKLKEDIVRLSLRMKLEGEVTGGKRLDESQIVVAAKSLRKSADSNYDVKLLTDDLRRMYNYMIKADNIEWQTVMGMATEIADKMLDNVKPVIVKDSANESILKDIRSVKIRLSDTQIQEAKNAWGEKYRNALMGRITTAKNGISLDSQWQEWSGMYPWLFNADVAEGDQITKLSEIYDDLKESQEVIEYYKTSEAVRDLAIKIYNKFWYIPTVTTMADKHVNEIKRLNFEHRKDMEELRNSYKARLEKQRSADRAYYKEVIRRVREDRELKLSEIRGAIQKRRADQKETLLKKAKIEKITNNAMTLAKWLDKNSAKEHIPDEFKVPVAELLNAIDFSSRQLLGMYGGERAYTPTRKDVSLMQALEKVHSMVLESEMQMSHGEFSGLDLPPQYAAEVDQLYKLVIDIGKQVQSDNGYVLWMMPLEQLEVLDQMVTIFRKTISNVNQMISSANAHSMDSLAQETIQNAIFLGQKKYDNKITKFFESDEALPYYAFKRMGKGAQTVFEALMDGFDKFAFHANSLKEFAEATYTEEEAKAWSNELYDLSVMEKGNEVPFQMTTAQIMSLYCLAKREQAKSHLVGGGIRIDNITIKGKKIRQPKAITLSTTDIQRIIDNLSDRQREVADALQGHMNGICKDWGNEVSLKRFGIKAFTEENYFPIKSDSNVIKGDVRDDESSIYRLLNMSFTKELTKNANNQIVISDIFSVFATHAGDMAKYNSIALPVLDCIKWWNYKETEKKKGETQKKDYTVKTALETAFGTSANTYIRQFLQDLNGTQEHGRGDELGKKLAKGYKTAAVGANLQVALLQPLSFIRAGYVMDKKYLAQALKRKPSIEKAKENSGMAIWKSLGFYDTNISKGLDAIIRHTDTKVEKVVEKSMSLAAFGDSLTWGYLWNACEAEIKDTTNLEVGSAGFVEAVSKRFREVIYATQVVDSTMTRSALMRSSSFYTQMLTAFMSEPTVTYNMLMDAYTEYNQTLRRTNNKGEALKKSGRKIALATEVYFLSAALEGVIRGILGQMRNPDEDEELIESIMDSFLDNANLLSKVPILKDIVSIFDGYSSSRMDTEVIQQFKYTVNAIEKVIQGEDWTYKTTYRLVTTISQATGLPLSGALREIVTIWNNTIGQMYPSTMLLK